MRRFYVAVAMGSVWACTLCAIAEPTQSTHEKDEAEIRGAIETYVKAYNQGDSQAVANLWSEDGEWLSPDGRRVQGRKAIATELAQVFKESPGLSIDVTDTRIRFITSDVAMEEGNATVSRNGEVTSESTYTAVHVKRDGKWQLDHVRETEIPDPVPPHAHLQELEWLVGDWVDMADDSTVETKVTWTKNKQFLTCNFRISLPDLDPMEGVQVIAWDAAAGVIRSWVFDSEGTIGEGTWSRDGDRWLVKSSQVLADGTRATSTNIYTIQDANSYTWKSIGRSVGNAFLPNIDDVLVVRKSALNIASSPNDAANEKKSAPSSPKSTNDEPITKKSKDKE